MGSRLLVLLLTLAALGGNAAPLASTAATLTVQRWSGPADVPMSILLPRAARLSRSTAPLGSDMSAGWRLLWDGSPVLPGYMVVRAQLAVRPKGQPGRESEVLQIGLSRDPAAVSSCLSYGLNGPNVQKLPDRVINGQRFSVWSNSDGGMSQGIAATDLRTVAHGVCYAVDRFSYSVSAEDVDRAVLLSEDAGSQALDKALSSLKLYVVRAGNVTTRTP